MFKRPGTTKELIQIASLCLTIHCSLYNGNRRLTAHGGLMIYLHDDFSYKEININATNYESNLFESLLAEIWRKDCAYQKFVVGNIYRLPSYLSADLRSFTNELTNLLNILRTRSKFVYICGDYNIDLLKIQTNDEFSIFYNNSNIILYYNNTIIVI